MHSTETTNEGTRSKRSLTRSGVSSASGEGQELRLSRGVVFGLWDGVSLWHGLSGTGLGVTCMDQLRANINYNRNHKSAPKQMCEMWKVRLMGSSCSGSVLTGVVVLLVHGGSIPASPCQEEGRSKSPPPSSCSPSRGLGDKEPSYNKHKQTFIRTVVTS